MNRIDEENVRYQAWQTAHKQKKKDMIALWKDEEIIASAAHAENKMKIVDEHQKKGECGAYMCMLCCFKGHQLAVMLNWHGKKK